MAVIIKIEKQHVYWFGLFAVVLLGGLLVRGFATGDPTFVGHSADEIAIPAFAKASLPTCSAGEKLTSNGQVLTCAADLQGSSGGGNGGNAASCNADNDCETNTIDVGAGSQIHFANGAILAGAGSTTWANSFSTENGPINGGEIFARGTVTAGGFVTGGTISMGSRIVYVCGPASQGAPGLAQGALTTDGSTCASGFGSDTALRLR